MQGQSGMNVRALAAPGLAGALCCCTCGGGLREDKASLHCTACLTSFPLVDGIPVMLPRASRVVAAALGAERRWRERAKRLHDEIGANGPTGASRAARAAHALCENLRLLPGDDGSMEHPGVTGKEIEDLLDAFATSHGGWSLDELLPYFHQDWGSRRHLQEAACLIRSSLQKHAPGWRSAAVLGAGACGLAYELAADAEDVFAVELSLPALRLARRVLNGDELVGYLQGADWRPFHMRRSGPRRDNLQLMVADVCALPFKAETKDVLVTQYLMDAVGNPWSVIDEIDRTLRPGGVWVNFSLPFRLPDEPLGRGRPQADELAALFAVRGLALIDQAFVRFSPVDVSDIYPEAMTFEQAVQFFVVRKSESRACLQGYRCLGETRYEVPRFARGRSAHLEATHSVSSGGTSTHRCLRIGGALGAFGVGSISADDARLLEDLLGAIDGQRAVLDIHAVLAGHGHSINEAQVSELLWYLGRRDGLLVFDTPRN